MISLLFPIDSATSRHVATILKHWGRILAAAYHLVQTAREALCLPHGTYPRLRRHRENTPQRQLMAICLHATLVGTPTSGWPTALLPYAFSIASANEMLLPSGSLIISTFAV
jgi:hypothetical protein